MRIFFFFSLWAFTIPLFSTESFEETDDFFSDYTSHDRQAMEALFWESALSSDPFSEELLEDEKPQCEEQVFTINIPLDSIFSEEAKSFLVCDGILAGFKIKWIVSCAFFDQIKPSIEEIRQNKVNLVHHFADLLPSQGKTLGLLTYQNGIKTTFDEFQETCQAIVETIPEGTLFIGLHNKTKGLARDLLRVLKELAAINTPSVLKARHFFQEIAKRVYAINPDLLWGSILHSEAGAIAKRAIEGMNPTESSFMRSNAVLFAMSPTLPIPMHLGRKVTNIYSKKDFIGVGGYLFGMGGQALAKNLFDAENCQLLFLSSLSPWNEQTLFLFDHAFLGTTYFTALMEQIERWRAGYGIYQGN